jgi:hypothetical protein
MGVESGKAIRARQRETATRVDRLIAKRDERAPIGRARRQRIALIVRQGRHALRSRDAAQAAVEAAERRVGVALVRMAADGLSLNDAFDVLGLSESVGRRLVRAAEPATRRTGTSSSTDPVRRRATRGAAGHGENGTTTQVSASAKGMS